MHRPADASREDDSILDAHRLELAVWMLCTAAAIGIGLYTLGAEFPARALALEGEAAIAVVVAGLVLASLRRQRPSVRADRSPRAQLVAIVLRLFVGVPVFAFALVVAASGFAA